jgi:hypothetical protein
MNPTPVPKRPPVALATRPNTRARPPVTPFARTATTLTVKIRALRSRIADRVTAPNISAILTKAWRAVAPLVIDLMAACPVTLRQDPSHLPRAARVISLPRWVVRWLAFTPKRVTRRAPRATRHTTARPAAIEPAAPVVIRSKWTTNRERKTALRAICSRLRGKPRTPAPKFSERGRLRPSLRQDSSLHPLTKASKSSLSWSLCVSVMPWGAPLYTLYVAFFTSFDDLAAAATMGTIWSSSP